MRKLLPLLLLLFGASAHAALTQGVYTYGAAHFNVIANTQSSAYGTGGYVTTQATGSTFVIGVTAPTTTVSCATAPTVTGFLTATSDGNTYTLKACVQYNGSTSTTWWYDCENCLGGANHNWTATQGSAGEMVIFVQEIKSSGGTYGVVDAYATSANYNFTAGVGSGPAVTSTSAGDVLVTFFGSAGTYTGTVTTSDATGWNSTTIQSSSQGTNTVVGASASIYEASAGSYNDIFTMSTTTYTYNAGIFTIAYKPYAAAIPVPVPVVSHGHSLVSHGHPVVTN